MAHPSAHKHFTRWTRNKLWQRIPTLLRGEDRTQIGRGKTPTCSTRTRAPRCGTCGPTRGYTGQAPAYAAARAGIELKIVTGPKPAGGFVVQPRRWVVERTNGWINRHRRLVRQYETTLTAHEGFVMLSQIRILLRRLDRRQLFDTL
ncbi:transposase [Isoptericola croceus]|uniref:transposase n=1 Tax=Isoptericola croceus TaxID=3031406 RepID=UPI0023F94FB8|nr:transposase [Isoptericola croceus]